MPTTPLPPESDVRALVRRVVEGVLSGEVRAEQPGGSAGSPAPSAEQPGGSAGSPAGSAEQPGGSAGSAEQPGGSAGSAEQPGGSAGSPGGDNIAIGADHGGFRLKEELVVKLGVAGHQVVDCGTDSAEPVDYPVIAHAVALEVAEGRCRWGIVVDGAGIGSAMVANKVPGIRAALCYDLSSARNSREHNHANVLTLGAGLVGAGLAWQIVQEWLAVPWGPDRHARRVAMIDDIEGRYRSLQAVR